MRPAMSAIAAIGCLLLVSPALAQQAGSAGGVVGKTGKSLSGGEAASPRSRPPQEKRAAPAPRKESGASCRDIVGTWKWYLGVTRMVFSSDGTVSNTDGNTGTWRCTGAATSSAVYANRVKESYSISKDGNSLFVSSTWRGGTAFTATRLGRN